MALFCGCADTTVTAIYVGAILNALAFKNRADNDHRGARFGSIGGPWVMLHESRPSATRVGSQWVVDHGCVSSPLVQSENLFEAGALP
jgi:hypothetical protein